jgi:hypothetical protein
MREPRRHRRLVRLDGLFEDGLCWEPLFAGEQTSVVELVDPEDAFSKQIYSLTNPNKDHLVERAIDWPGASSLEAQLHDKVITVRRPSWFFDRDGKMPKQVTLRFTRPPGFEQLSQAQWIAKLKEGIAAAEAAAACERAASGKRVLGVKAIKRQSAFDSPKSHAPRRELNPRVAARNKWRRIEALRRNKQWLAAYRDAMRRYNAGDRDAPFPFGTYKMQREAHVPIDVTAYLARRSAA